MAQILTLTVLATGTGAVAFAQDTLPDKPPVKDYTVMIAKTKKSRQSVQAKQGSYCLPAADGSGGTCHTATFPLKDLPVIKVSKGEQVTLLFKIPVGYLTYRVARVSNGREVVQALGEAEQVTKTKKRFRVTLPKNLRKSATILGFYVEYVNSYSSFEVGLKVR